MKDSSTDAITLAFLKSHALFAEIEDQSLINVLCNMRQENIKKGQIVVREGDKGDCLFLIVEGTVGILKEIPASAGRSMEKIATLGKGDTFGEMAIIDQLDRSASVRAEEDSILLTLSKEGLAKVKSAAPNVHNLILSNLAKEVSRRLRNIDRRFAISLFSIKTR